MPHVITSLCLREGSCALVCPVECIVPGNPQDEYPGYYIDADTCIDCGACMAECPYEAIYADSDLPANLKAKPGQRQSKPVGTPGFTEEYKGEDHDHQPVLLKATKTYSGGEILDLSSDLEMNADFFKNGPGYRALEK